MSVLYLLTEGLTDRQIALSLDVTGYTVNKHIGSILAKMAVTSRTAAAVRAVRQHLFEADGYRCQHRLELGRCASECDSG
jgi:DNA-binding NarL/FixJ family response regulator